MKAQKKALAILTLLTLVLPFTGCSGKSMTAKQTGNLSQPQEETEAIQKNLDGFEGEEAYESRFDKPHVKPNIYIDKNGYDIFDTKAAYFVGEELDSSFSIYDGENGSVVYTGKMIPVDKDPITNKSVYKGDFSEVKTPGTFYVQTSVIGRSYCFVIEKDHDKALLKEISERLLKDKSEDFFAKGEEAKMRESLYGMLQLCMASELGETIYDEKMVKKLSAHAQWLLKWKEEAEKKQTFSSEEQFLLSTVFSQTADVILETDQANASACKKQAQLCYEMANQLSDISDHSRAARQLAAASLYKTTGNAGYHQMVKEIEKERQKERVQVSENTVQAEFTDREAMYQEFLASYYYMTTEYSVDVSMCEDMMSRFMRQCTRYLDYSASAAFGLTEAVTDETKVEDQILLDATQLAVADYTIVSREYRNVCRQQMHFLLYDKELDELDEPKLTALWLIMSIIGR